MVVDVDIPSLEWWNQLVQINGGLPETFTVQTPSGGYHYYFRYTPIVAVLGNMNGILGQSIDYRTTGGMAIFPSSIDYATGKMYQVVAGYYNNQPIIAQMPDWLLDLLKYNQQLRHG